VWKYGVLQTSNLRPLRSAKKKKKKEEEIAAAKYNCQPYCAEIIRKRTKKAKKTICLGDSEDNVYEREHLRVYAFTFKIHVE